MRLKQWGASKEFMEHGEELDESVELEWKPEKWYASLEVSKKWGCFSLGGWIMLMSFPEGWNKGIWKQRSWNVTLGKDNIF